MVVGHRLHGVDELPVGCRGVRQALGFPIGLEVAPHRWIGPIRARKLVGLTCAGFVFGGMGRGVRIIFIGGKGKGIVASVGRVCRHLPISFGGALLGLINPIPFTTAISRCITRL